jgi:hypothetical protein
MDEKKVGKSMETSDLVKLGIFWFDVMETGGCEVMWER